jgi:SAM-dependent methyltransferase
MAASGKIRLTAHIEVEWLHGQTAPAICPNCGHAGEMTQVIVTDYTPPGQERLRLYQQLCPHCSVRFVDDMHTMDYAGEHLIELGWHSYQAQVGAGIWPITAPLTRIVKPAAARVLEIGGAYGFGLDFCAQVYGWQGEGFDPSPLAAYGVRELGLNIRQDYFTKANLAAGPWDVVIATEVVEHIPNPPDFLRLLRAAMAADGVLVLTTPDAEAIRPELGKDELVAILAPDAHLILQTRQSLEHVLRTAGFTHVAIRREGMTLIAYASPAPFTLREDPAAGHEAYRRYLARRSAQSSPGSDTQLGFAGRALFEAVNAADWAAAETAWAALRGGVNARFGYDLDDLTALPPGCEESDLAGLVEKIPLGLGMILFSRAMWLLAHGEARAALRPLFTLAGQAVAVLQNALARRSLVDGLAANIAELAAVELQLCAAEAGEAESVAGLLKRGDVIAGWRGFVALVNAGAFTLAAELKNKLLPDLPGGDLPAGLRRDALLSLTNFHLAPGADAAQALPVAEALGAAGGDVILAAFTRLVNASRYAEALAAAQRYNVAALAAGMGITARDARLAQIVLDLAVGDPAAIPARLQGVELEPARRDTLLLEAFIRLVNASRYQEALDFIAAHDVPALRRRVSGKTVIDAAIAQAVLELEQGDPAFVPRHLAGLDVPPLRADALILGAFTTLVNSGRYDEAEALAASAACLAKLPVMKGAAASDARVAAMMLDLQRGRVLAAVQQMQALAANGADAPTLAALYVDAFIRLVNAGDFAQARKLAEGEAIEQSLRHCSVSAQQDALLALLLQELQPGGHADAVPRRLAALRTTRIDPTQLRDLALIAFTTLVNQQEFIAAQMLLPLVEPELRALHPPFTATERDALFAAGGLYLAQQEWQRSITSFSRLRDKLAKATTPPLDPGPLFWPALRGEVVALHQLQRYEEATLLLRDYLGAYPGAPDDLRQQIETHGTTEA